MPTPSSKQNSILLDHIKKGKKFIPPYIAAFGTPEDISWNFEILPEVFWIALLHHKYGEKRGTELALQLAQVCAMVSKNASVGFDSGFIDFGPELKQCIQQSLSSKGILTELRDGIKPLLVFAPDTCLQFLADGVFPSADEHRVDEIKAVVAELFNKEARFTVMVQATVVYIAFVLDKIKVMEGLALARFPEIESYPDTELSLQIASSIRSTLLILFNSRAEYTKNNWANRFWNHGMRNDPCHS